MNLLLYLVMNIIFIIFQRNNFYHRKKQFRMILDRDVVKNVVLKQLKQKRQYDQRFQKHHTLLTTSLNMEESYLTKKFYLVTNILMKQKRN